MSQRWLSRSEILRFNPRWSDRDRDKVAAVLDRYQPQHCYTVDSSVYVSGRDDDGNPIIWIYNGFITEAYQERPGGRVLERTIEVLSNHYERGASPHRPDRAPGEVCQVCWVERSRSGACNCD